MVQESMTDIKKESIEPNATHYLRQRTTILLRAVVVIVMSASFVYSAMATLHWALMIDSPIMHYVNLLMHHGFRPYADITDNNMPGAYLTEGWAMKIFGSTDLGWRVYEFTLLFCLILSMSVIARKYDWVAGVFAGGTFVVMHVSEGPWVAAEREEVLTALLLIGFAALFSSTRTKLPALTFIFGFLGALAGSIKPTFVPLPLIVFVLQAIHLKHENVRARRYVAWGAFGFVAVLWLDLGFLIHYRVLEPFIFVLRNVLPTYAALAYAPHTTKELIQLAMPSSFALLAIAAGVLFILNQDLSWEKAALAIAALFGLVSYFVQHKGFQHHRYTFLAFLLLLIGLELFQGLRASSTSFALSLAAIAFTLLHVVPPCIRVLRSRSPSSSFTIKLESDLQQVGTPLQLQRNVECFDLVFGCINALYHLQLVGHSGFTGDLLFFSQTGSKASSYYRHMFWKTQAEHPAEIIVVSNEWFGHGNSFAKLKAWPEFASYLDRNYAVIMSRSFPTELIGPGQTPYDEASAPAYRIYVRRDRQPLVGLQTSGSKQIPAQSMSSR